MQRTIARLAAHAVALMLLAPAPASAQFGKLVKKAKEAAGVDKSAPAAAATAAPAGPVSVNAEWELTKANLDRFAAGLEADKASRAASVKMLATIKTKSAYDQCGMAFATGPDYQKLMSDYNAQIAKAADQDAQMKIGQAFGENLQAAMQKRCGPDPSRYPESQRQSVINADAEKAAIEKSGFTPRVYGVLKERIAPFCAADAATRGSGDVRLPGSGRGIFYVYTAAESAELAPRCAPLLDAMRASS